VVLKGELGQGSMEAISVDDAFSAVRDLLAEVGASQSRSPETSLFSPRTAILFSMQSVDQGVALGKLQKFSWAERVSWPF